MVKDTNPFGARAIHPSSLPRWMVPGKTSKDTTPKHPSMPSMQIYLFHNTDQKTKHSESLEAHVKEHVELEGLTMPETKLHPAKDPRYFQSGKQWRDTVRRQLNLEKLKLEFFTMHLELVGAEGSSEKKIQAFGPAKGSPWSEVRGALLQTDIEARFTYTLRPLEEDEEFELEYHGVPISLQTDFRVGGDGDIERVQLLPHINPINEEEAIENTAFLSGGGVTVKRRPVPQSEFSVDDRESMLLQHDGYDVLADQGLRDWQFYVTETVAGN